MNKEKIILLIVTILIISMVVFSRLKNRSRINNELEISFKNNISRFLNESLVNKLLIQNMQFDKNESNLTLDLKEIEDFLEIQPEILNAEVYMTPDGKLKTKIFERKPIIRIQQDGFYLDENGIKIPLSSNYFYKVPIFSDSFKNQNIDEIVYLTKIMSNDRFFKNEFAEMWIENNQYYMRFRNFDFNIIWGYSNRTDEKLKKLKAFCTFIQGNSIDYSPKKIDLSIESQIVAID